MGTKGSHGSTELDEDAAKLIGMGKDPGPTLDELEVAPIEEIVARLTDAELRRWRLTLDKVTPGPYRHSPWHIEEAEEAVRCAEGHAIANVPSSADAGHFARCDPQTIGELIDEVLAYRGSNGSHGSNTARNAALDEAAKVALQTCDELEEQIRVYDAIIALKNG